MKVFVAGATGALGQQLFRGSSPRATRWSA